MSIVTDRTSQRNKSQDPEPHYPPEVLALKNLPDPYENPEPINTRAEDKDYGDIYSLLEQLTPHVFQNLPFDHPLRIAFFNCITDSDECPNLEVVRKILAAFQSLPDDQRRQILNGWDLFPEDLNCDREWVKYRAAEYVIKLGMQFCADEDPRGEISGELVNYFSESIRPVTLVVQAGARKMQVVETLRRLADSFEREWESLVGADQWKNREAAGEWRKKGKDKPPKIFYDDPRAQQVEPTANATPRSTPNAIQDFDSFYASTTEILDRLNIAWFGVENGAVVMPDGTKRKLCQISEQVNEGANGTKEGECFLGPIITEEDDAKPK